MKILIFAILMNIAIFATSIISQTVVPNDKTYYKHTQDKVEILYTKEHLKFAKHTSKLEPAIHKQYENIYSWRLDEKLSVGLISSHNQIANGFSTQFGNNKQINYVGGTSLVDYFTSTSWLDTLLYHETAHNYQLNVKSSSISQFLHSVFGNGSFFVPTFTIPNMMENSFLLEGNAVLNESWHGNGGRLYSGRLKAQTILQAKAGKIKPGEVYNQKIEFPYREIWYIQGGFYNLYMAERYGLKNINSYFKYHSEDWWFPAFTNASMIQAVGISFEDSLKDFSDKYAAMDLELASGDLITSSQFFYPLNSDKDEIYFITNETGVQKPELIVYEKKSASITKDKDSWHSAKVIKHNDKYLTQGSAHISPTKIMQGLFDSGKFIEENTASKMVQGYLSDGRIVYFDVTSSFSEPQLYIGDKFYAKVNSSVIIDKDDNLYYFVQNKKTRTLYKNKIALFSFEEFYAIVSDVDTKGGIYFIANSKNGSSLYLFKNAKVSRVSDADNIIDAKLINDNEVLLAAISDKDYYYVKTNLKSINQSPYSKKLFFESKPYYASIKEENKKEKLPNLSNEYNSFLDMRYSGINFNIAKTDTSTTGLLNINFADPLAQNFLSFFLNKDADDITIGGINYQSALNRLTYGVYAYGVINNSQKDIFGNEVEVQNHGVSAYASFSLYQAGYYEAFISSSYYQDYTAIDRKPLNLSLTLSKTQYFANSRYPNSLYYLNAYATQDRGDTLYGGNLKYTHDLPFEFYLSLDAKYSYTSSNITNFQAYYYDRGVKISPTLFASYLDPTTISMNGINFTNYVKNAGYLNIRLNKVINLSSYWFTFPLSLQRESIYMNYKTYKITDFINVKDDVTEITAGLTMDLVLLNNVVFPLSIEYVKNDSRKFVENEQSIYVTIGLSI